MTGARRSRLVAASGRLVALSRASSPHVAEGARASPKALSARAKVRVSARSGGRNRCGARSSPVMASRVRAASACDRAAGAIVERSPSATARSRRAMSRRRSLIPALPDLRGRRPDEQPEAESCPAAQRTAANGSAWIAGVAGRACAPAAPSAGHQRLLPPQCVQNQRPSPAILGRGVTPRPTIARVTKGRYAASRTLKARRREAGLCSAASRLHRGHRIAGNRVNWPYSPVIPGHRTAPLVLSAEYRRAERAVTRPV
jgi:hypothetical protein